MNPKNNIIIIGELGGRTHSIAKLIENETSVNVEVSPFAPEPIEFKITSHTPFDENFLRQKQFYENQPSKFIGKPRNNFKK